MRERNGRPRLSSERFLLCLLIAWGMATSFGILKFKMGFYADDWTMLKAMTLNPRLSFWEHAKAFYLASPWRYRRPVGILYALTFYRLFGPSAWAYQITFLLLDIAVPLLFFLVFERFSGNRRLSFLTALLFALYPNHSMSHHFFTAPMVPALLLIALSLERYFFWVERRGRRDLALSGFFFVAASLTYEAVLPLTVLYVALDFVRRLRQGLDWKSGLRRSLGASATIWALLVLLIFYQTHVQSLFPRQIGHPLAFDFRFALKVLGVGLECSTTRVLHLFWVYVPKAFSDLPLKLWLADGTALLVLIVGCLTVLPDEEKPPSGLLPAWAAAGAIATAACYGIFCFSAEHYTPQIFSPMNRLNAAASIGPAMILGAVLSALSKRTLRKVLAPILILFTLVNWRTSWDWKLSADMERKVLSDLQPKLASIQGPAVVVVKGVPPEIGSAFVFGLINDALQYTTGRADLYAVTTDDVSFSTRTPRMIYDMGNGSLTPQLAP